MKDRDSQLIWESLQENNTPVEERPPEFFETYSLVELAKILEEGLNPEIEDHEHALYEAKRRLATEAVDMQLMKRVPNPLPSPPPSPLASDATQL